MCIFVLLLLLLVLIGCGDGQVLTVPGPLQHKAIDSLLATITPDALRIPKKLVAIIPPRPPSSGDTREIFHVRLVIGLILMPLLQRPPGSPWMCCSTPPVGRA